MGNSESTTQSMRDAQLFRLTERQDTHAIQIADLAARMRITEEQSQNLWTRLGELDKNSNARHSEILDSLTRHQTSMLEAMALQKEELTKEIHVNRVASAIVDTKGKTIAAVFGWACAAAGAVWGLWQVVTAAISFFGGT